MKQDRVAHKSHHVDEVYNARMTHRRARCCSPAVSRATRDKSHLAFCLCTTLYDYYTMYPATPAHIRSVFMLLSLSSSSVHVMSISCNAGWHAQTSCYYTYCTTAVRKWSLLVKNSFTLPRPRSEQRRATDPSVNHVSPCSWLYLSFAHLLLFCILFSFTKWK